MEVETAKRSKTTVNLPSSEGLPLWRPKTSVNRQPKGNFNIFSRMSKEALQAINETRNELIRPTKTTATAMQPPIPKISTAQIDLHQKPQTREDDTDSAIGTSSQVSQSSEKHTKQAPEQDNTCTIKSPEHMDTAIHPPRSTTKEKLDLPMITSPPPKPGEITEIKTTFGSMVSSSAPLVPVPEYKNVFERLSSNYKPVQKITARQRSKARLTLRLMKNGPLSSLPSHSNYRSLRVKKELPGLPSPYAAPDSNKIRKQPAPTQSSPAETHQEEEDRHQERLAEGLSSPNENTEEHVNKPQTTAEKRVNTAKTISSRRPVSQISNRGNSHYNKDYEKEEHYIPPLIVPDINPEAFEITPIGYDSRYSALQYNDTLHGYSDDEEAQEIIKQAKIKCRQWLTKQLQLIHSST